MSVTTEPGTPVSEMKVSVSPEAVAEDTQRDLVLSTHDQITLWLEGIHHKEPDRTRRGLNRDKTSGRSGDFCFGSRHRQD
jgi:hypothetical protein